MLGFLAIAGRTKTPFAGFSVPVENQPHGSANANKTSSVACFVRIHVCDRGLNQTQLLHISIRAIACAT